MVGTMGSSAPLAPPGAPPDRLARRRGHPRRVRHAARSRARQRSRGTSPGRGAAATARLVLARDSLSFEASDGAPLGRLAVHARPRATRHGGRDARLRAAHAFTPHPTPPSCSMPASTCWCPTRAATARAAASARMASVRRTTSSAGPGGSAADRQAPVSTGWATSMGGAHGVPMAEVSGSASELSSPTWPTPPSSRPASTASSGQICAW